MATAAVKTANDAAKKLCAKGSLSAKDVAEVKKQKKIVYDVSDFSHKKIKHCTFPGDSSSSLIFKKKKK